MPTHWLARTGTKVGLAIVGWLSVAAVAPPTPPPPPAPTQLTDDRWTPSVTPPAFAVGTGPRALIDAAHGNFHTADGRYRPFARLLTSDGYRVGAAETPITSELLQNADILVIANPVLGGDKADWILPTPPAFTESEIRVLQAWVSNGGSLLLIADHMPFPGSAEGLAQAFGIVFSNGYALPSPKGSGILSFTREAGTLKTHPVTVGRRSSESVTSVRSFTGQAFRAVVPIDPIMTMPDDWSVFLPKDTHDIAEDTPKISTRGLLQGAVLRHGRGRVAVFGEAAMFSAQSFERDEKVVQIGMNHPDAADNDQFALNVMHWLSGLIDDGQPAAADATTR